ncbi:O-antigen ligase family protein [Pelagibacterium sp. 26DY04]|uniref:O-antigen ligase family protein n=1 Tax=Pelagibacterium sp. 26DY04 TaxID=2967130 RepID=UPI002814B488|nr:O-antigen ligase family protein [Pelagibacterium sp. 26DY04]WMT85554.1 O-antigen ligase family protein [Pelagibacterium sp. 26DY04]
MVFWGIFLVLLLACFRGPLTFLMGNLATVAVAFPVFLLALLIDWPKALHQIRRPEIWIALCLIVWTAIKIPFSDSLVRGSLGFGHLAFPIVAFLIFLALMSSANLRPRSYFKIALGISAVLAAGVAVEVVFDQPLSTLLQHSVPQDVAEMFAPFRVGSFIGASLPFGVVISLLLPFVIVAALRQPNVWTYALLVSFVPMILATYGRGAMLQSAIAALAAIVLLAINRYSTPANERVRFPRLPVWQAASAAALVIAALPFAYNAVPNSISDRFESGLSTACGIASFGRLCIEIPVTSQAEARADGPDISQAESQSGRPDIPQAQAGDVCDVVLSVRERRGDDFDADAVYDRCLQGAASGLDVSSIGRFEVYNAIFAYQDTWTKRIFGGSLMASGNFVKNFGFDYLIPGVEASESYYLKLYSEVGLVGAVLFVALLLTAIVRPVIRAFTLPKDQWTFAGLASAAALAGISLEMAFLQSLENPVVALVFGWVLAIAVFSAKSPTEEHN